MRKRSRCPSAIRSAKRPRSLLNFSVAHPLFARENYSFFPRNQTQNAYFFREEGKAQARPRRGPGKAQAGPGECENENARKRAKCVKKVAFFVLLCFLQAFSGVSSSGYLTDSLFLKKTLFYVTSYLADALCSCPPPLLLSKSIATPRRNGCSGKQATFLLNKPFFHVKPLCIRNFSILPRPSAASMGCPRTSLSVSTSSSLPARPCLCPRHSVEIAVRADIGVVAFPYNHEIEDTFCTFLIYEVGGGREGEGGVAPEACASLYEEREWPPFFHLLFCWEPWRKQRKPINCQSCSCSLAEPVEARLSSVLEKTL